MPPATRPPFMRRLAGALRTPPAPDLADMGTAFALDHCLDQSPDDHLDGALPLPRTVTPVAPWRLWLGRKLGA